MIPEIIYTSLGVNMKLLYFVLILLLTQLWPISLANPIPTNITKNDLLEFYDKELQIIAEEFCEKAKNVSEKLLDDKDIKEASTPELKEFRNFLQTLLRDYPHFKRYKIQGPLLEVLIRTVIMDLDILRSQRRQADLKFREIVKKYFSNILQEYEQIYGKFLKEKFLKKMENFKQQSSANDLKQMPKIDKFIDQLRTCQSYECFPTNLDELLVAVNANPELAKEYINKDDKIVMFSRCLLEYKMVKMILNDERFSELSLEFKQIYTKDINEFISSFENQTDIKQFLQLTVEKLNYPRKYGQYKQKANDSNTEAIDVPSKDQELLKEILEKNVANLMKSKFELEFNSVVSEYFLKLIIVGILL
ncbi:uncharacterized protein ACRADG_006008 [Cochliomyia hominivorax]